MVAADARTAMSFSLSPGNAGVAPEGHEVLKQTTLLAKYVSWTEPMKAMKHANWCSILV